MRKSHLFPCALPTWLIWFVVGLFVAAIVSVVVTRSVAIRAPPRKAKLCLEEALPTLRSGDVLLQAGVGLMGRTQRFILNTPISHTGVIIMEREGTAEATAWVLEAGREHGVTLTPLWEWLQDKDSRIFYRALSSLGSGPRDQGGLAAFVSRQLGRPYSYRFWMEAARILPFALPMPFDHEGKDEARFCSELVAEALVAAGALEADQPCHTVMPRDLLEEPDSSSNKSDSCDEDGKRGNRGGESKLQWRDGWGMGRVQSLVTNLSAYEVGRRAAEQRKTPAPHEMRAFRP